MKCLVLVSGTLPDFRWLKWDKSITFVSNIRDNLEDGAFQLIDPRYYSTIRQRGESYGSELKISNVTEEDFGLYTCYASNHIGAEYNSAFLSRYVRPTRTLPSDRGKAIKGAMSDYLLSFLEANRFSHQLNFKKKKWSSFVIYDHILPLKLFPVVCCNGWKGWTWINTLKIWANLFKFWCNACKKSPKQLWCLVLLYENCTISSL